MCDLERRECNRKLRNELPLADLPHVRIELPLKQLNQFYEDVGQARRVLREGNPELKVKLALNLLDRVSCAMDDASGGFLAPRHI